MSRVLINEEIQQRIQGTLSHIKASVVENRGSKHEGQYQNNKGRSRSLECYFLGKMGYIKKYCFS